MLNQEQNIDQSVTARPQEKFDDICSNVNNIAGEYFETLTYSFGTKAKSEGLGLGDFRKIPGFNQEKKLLSILINTYNHVIFFNENI